MSEAWLQLSMTSAVSNAGGTAEAWHSIVAPLWSAQAALVRPRPQTRPTPFPKAQQLPI